MLLSEWNSLVTNKPLLIHELDYHIDLTPGTLAVGKGPYGLRIVGQAKEGIITGKRINGTIGTGGGDYMLVGDDGFARVDVRTVFETGDGANIYVQYLGLLELTEGIRKVLNGGDTPTEFGDQHFFVTPRMETGDERYAWVNHSTFVAQGRILPGVRIEFRVYRIVNS
jgi:hypothetical protein